MNQKETIHPVESVRFLLKQENRIELAEFLESLSSNEVVYMMSKLGKKDQHKLFSIIKPEDAADVIEELPDSQAADILEEMDAGNAAAIINKMNSDDRVDLMIELDKEEAEAILTEMQPAEAASIRRMIEYHPKTAGGIMVTEYISYQSSSTVQEVIDDLRQNAEKYKNYHVRYIYVVSEHNQFTGVL
jgi:magnesium transporter